MPVKMTENEFLKRMNERDDIQAVGKFVSSMEKILFKCNKCGHQWMLKPMYAVCLPVEKRSSCPICANEKRKKNLHQPAKNYLEKIRLERHDGADYEWIDKDYNRDNKVKKRILHKCCGNIFSIRPNDFQQGYGCPFCSKNYEYKNSVVYLKQLFDDKEKFLKIGVDTTSRRHFKHYKQKNILFTERLSEKEARKIEQALLKFFKPCYNYKPKEEFSGFTECFVYSKDLIEKIEEKIKELYTTLS